jgi:hypothetical protein
VMDEEAFQIAERVLVAADGGDSPHWYSGTIRKVIQCESGLKAYEIVVHRNNERVRVGYPSIRRYNRDHCSDL